IFLFSPSSIELLDIPGASIYEFWITSPRIAPCRSGADGYTTLRGSDGTTAEAFWKAVAAIAIG
ncbi:MAG: hypothetical protein ACXWIS_24930, partial [Burkholderiales bacterium]